MQVQVCTFGSGNMVYEEKRVKCQTWVSLYLAWMGTTQLASGGTINPNMTP